LSVCSARISGMFVYFRHLLGWILSTFNSRTDLVLENGALRRQLLVLHTQRPRRRLSTTQKLFWVVLRRLWSGWQKALVLVTPRTVVEWHRAGFRLYWKWLSRTRQVGGRKPVSRKVQALIFRMRVCQFRHPGDKSILADEKGVQVQVLFPAP
jgi:putative transposase